jgi:hypothetical protein
MSTVVIVTISILLIVSAIINIILITKAVKLNKTFKTGKTALQHALSNDKCGQKCTSNSLTATVPPNITQQFDPTVAFFCTQAILCFVHAVKNKTEVVFPDGLTKITPLKISTSSIPTIGWICKDEFNRLWIIFRGTQTKEELLADLEFSQTTTQTQGGIHQGFYNLYQQFQQVITDTIKSHNPEQVIVTGQSLGSALATITLSKIIDRPHVGYGFASPRVGDLEFFQQFNHRWFNIMNLCDIFTTAPFAVTPNLKDPSTPIIYKHVGEIITFSKNWESWLANHELPVYQSFLSSF